MKQMLKAPWLVWLALLVITPVGLWLLWRSSRFRLASKVFLSLLFVAVFALEVMSLVPSGNDTLLGRVTDDTTDYLDRYFDAGPRPGYHEVTKVIDGDTIQVIMHDWPRTVDLVLIEAPELSPVKEPLAREARAHLEELIGENDVRITVAGGFRTEWQEFSAYVYLPGGRMLNEMMVSAGLARVVPAREEDTHLEELQALEAEARDAKRGIWSLESSPDSIP